MAQKDPINGETVSRRHLTTYQEYLVQKNITDDLPPAERIKKVADLCRVFAAGAQHLSDNLQPGEIEKRVTYHEGVPCSIDAMQLMLEEDAHVVSLIGSCVKDMARFKESKMNGASVEFQACSEIYLEQKERLKAGRKALAGLLHPEKTANSGFDLRMVS